jgi:hypothetical protein
MEKKNFKNCPQKGLHKRFFPKKDLISNIKENKYLGDHSSQPFYITFGYYQVIRINNGNHVTYCAGERLWTVGKNAHNVGQVLLPR